MAPRKGDSSGFVNEDHAPIPIMAEVPSLTNEGSRRSVKNEIGGGGGATKRKGDVGGVNIAFSNLTYSVPMKTKKKKNNDKDSGEKKFTILHGIDGSFLPGRMTALMGPSGSGKSTLLDVLSGRKNSGTTTGTISLNGDTKPSGATFKRLVGYVEQFDTLVGELTVEQMLSYTAWLKLPALTTPDERRARVEEVISTLDLMSCRHTVIGSALVRGISGGQAKRVNIGLALITRPSVLFLDEPTSGLDSRTADDVVSLLRQLASPSDDVRAGGRTIVCTIHSPTGRGFALFDDLHMLHGGRTIYDGPVSDVQAYFENLGHVRDPDCSLPEWLVDLTSDSSSRRSAIACDIEGGGGQSDKHSPTASTHPPTPAAAVRNFSDLYDRSDAKRASIVRRDSTLSAGTDEQFDMTQPGEFSKLLTLLRFRMVAHYKSGEYLGTRFGDKIVFSIMILSLYFGIGDETDSQSIASTSSLLYFISAICGYGASAFVPSLTMERSLYYRELADGCYAPSTYYASKFVEEGLLASLTSAVFCIIVYFGCALQGNFAVFFASYYLTTMMGIILAYAIAAVAPSMEAANALLPSLVTIWMYFGGLFIVFDKIPIGWRWFSWTSFLRYSWGSMMLNQFQGQTNGQIPIFYGEDGRSMTVLEFYGLEGPIMGSIGANLGLLLALISFFAIVGMIGLKKMRHSKR